MVDEKPIIYRTTSLMLPTDARVKPRIDQPNYREMYRPFQYLSFEIEANDTDRALVAHILRMQAHEIENVGKPCKHCGHYACEPARADVQS